MAIHYDSFRVHVLAALDVFFDDLAVLAMVARAHRRHRVTGQLREDFRPVGCASNGCPCTSTPPGNRTVTGGFPSRTFLIEKNHQHFSVLVAIKGSREPYCL